MIKNVLSLFDGISVGRIALDKAKIKYDKYYASEVDKFAIAVAKYNYPDTIFVGDVKNLKKENFENIDLLIGGSPCQNFSFSGKKNGMVTKEQIEVTTLEQYIELKEKKFEFDGQSYLFWEFVRLLREIKPKYFLLENVKMMKKWEKIINSALGIEPIEINSALVSAQNRRRLYWTNISVKNLPVDRNILLEDILESKISKKYYIDFNEEDITVLNKKTRYNIYKYASVNSISFEARKYILGVKGKHIALGTRNSTKIFYKKKYRTLTPIEWERLQTLSDNYTRYGLFENNEVREIKDYQRYKMIGNSWTADIIAWIFSFIKV